MKLPKLFGKKNNDDDEDDDFDEDDFDVDELDDDDLDDLDEPVGVTPTMDAADEDIDDDDDDDHEEMVGSDDDVENPFDDDEDEDEYEYDDDDYDDEEEEASSRKKAIVFAAVGFGVLFISIMGGVGWWFLSGDSTETAAEQPEKRPGVVEMAMPAAPGSLNAGGSGASLNSLGNGTGDVAAAATTAPVAPASPPATDNAEPDTGGTTFEVSAAQPAGGLNSLNTLNALGSSSAGGGLVIPAVASTAMGRIPDQPTAADQTQALSSAPLKALLEEKDGIGELPKIASNGATSWQAYARPIDPAITEPKIALMIENIGLSRQASLGAINKLPPEVSMALNPYARDLSDWVFRSRLAGHEVYMLLPMESEDFPLEDAGPLALDTRIQLAENQRRLDTVLASAGGYVGVVSFMGSRFLKAEGQLRQVLQELNNRGLMFVTGGAKSRNDAIPIAKELKMVHMESQTYIDETPRIQQIRTTLDQMESIAKERGSVLVMARPYPVTIQSVLDWIATLKDKGINLVPASAVATLPEVSQ